MRALLPPYAEPEPLSVLPATDTRGAALLVAAGSLQPNQLDSLSRSLRHAYPFAALLLGLAGVSVPELKLAMQARDLGFEGVVLLGEPLREAMAATLLDGDHLGQRVLDWIKRMGGRPGNRTEPALTLLLQDTVAHRSMEGLLRHMGEPPRTLRAALLKRGLPPPRAWAQLGLGLNSALLLQQRPAATLLELGLERGYADHSGLVQELRRQFGVRPADVRGTLGWTWLLNRWWLRWGSPRRGLLAPGSRTAARRDGLPGLRAPQRGAEAGR